MFYDFFLRNIYIFDILFFVLLLLVCIEFTMFKRNKNAINSDYVIKLIDNDKAVIIDFRTLDEFRTSHILNSINMRYDNIKEQSILFKKHKNRPIIVICNTDTECLKVIKVLSLFVRSDLFYLKGGFASWLNEDLPIVSN